MKTPFLPKVGFCLVVALSLIDISCASSPAPVSPPTKTATANGREVQRDDDITASQLVGVWQGFWSLKGRVATDQFLFLNDGRWGWLATADIDATDTVQPVRRSGRWEVKEGVVVITELRRKEIIGCERDSSWEQTCEDKRDCEACTVEYRTVRHDSPVVEQLAIGRCPDNQEAKKLDREYTCVTIGERVFWRKAVPAKNEQERFFEGQ